MLIIASPAVAQVYDTAVSEEVEEPPGSEEYEKTDDGDEMDDYFEKRSGHDPVPLTNRNISPDKIKDTKDQKAFWYADAVFEEEEKAEGRSDFVPLGQRQWFQTLLWIVIIGAFIAFIAIYLGSNNVGLFRKKDRTLEESAEEEMNTTDIFSINYQKEIDRAAAQGNFRLAIRLMYLRLLKELSERNIIKYSQEKTNFDYLLQLHPTRYYQDFFRITRHYEYSWYGQFEVNEDAYKVIRSDVDKFDREAR